MKKATIILLIFTVVCSCGKRSNSGVHTVTREEISSKVSVPKVSPIKVFNIVYDSTCIDTSGQLSLLNKNLDGLFRESKYTRSNDYMDGWMKEWKNKSFATLLARDFENDDFRKATQIYGSFLEKEQEEYSRYIRVEEWCFKDDNTAKSCFESFDNYQEREIHFKSIHWIWIELRNKLFFISTMDYMTSSEPMQTVKQHLINKLKEQGEYRIIEMY
ncbi:MAG: hypothetical protein ACK5IQ_10245 [Bacteroidales bacterium]